MSQVVEATLTNVNGDDISLKDIDIEAQIKDLISDVCITQTYQNLDKTNIEAVYTFPLPVDAVLLELTVVIGEKTLQGVVIEKHEAEERYEEAITDGDSPIMLQENQPGIFTMNIGNILPNEEVEIKFRYGALHQYQNNTLRFFLPTTIAPRYGMPESVGFEPHQVPEFSLENNFKFSIKIFVVGILTNAEIHSPTHSISSRLEDTKIVIKLTECFSTLDRDFVLKFDKIPSGESFVQVEKDNNGFIGLASFQCNFETNIDPAPRSYKVLVDCSGSMTGDSIEQTKKALRIIQSKLRDGDFINIIKFGSRCVRLSPEQICISESNRVHIANYINHIEADMGGTALEEALDSTYQISEEMDIKHDILLITDGEVWGAEDLIRKASKSKHRIFSVGVGSSVAENVVRSLSEDTGGVCELVTPNESMSEKIYRHFNRINTLIPKKVDVIWNINPKLTSPKIIRNVYPGDTLNIYSWFNEKPTGEVQLVITLENGTVITESSDCVYVTNENDENFLARLAIANLIKCNRALEGGLLDEKPKEELALEYQLMTPWTNYLIVHKRDVSEAPDQLPELRKVPQMLAAGWSGMGSVIYDDSKALYDSVSYDSFECVNEELNISNFLDEQDISPSLFEDNEMMKDITKVISSVRGVPIEKEWNTFLDNLDESLQEKKAIEKFEMGNLAELGMPEGIIKEIQELLYIEYSDAEIVLFLLVLILVLGFDNDLSLDSRITLKQELRNHKEATGLFIEILDECC